MDTSPNAAIRCPPTLRDMALRSLHENLPHDLQSGLVQALDSIKSEDETAWDGLFICQEGGQVSVAWGQQLPGQMAALWPPAAEAPAAKKLLQRLGGFLDQRAVVIIQLLIGIPQETARSSHHALVQLLTSCDYGWLANLQYLMAESRSFPPTPPTLALKFESHAGEQPQRLQQLIAQTYIETCDCPAIDGIRPMSQVLASYRSTGCYHQDSWFFVQHQGLDIGVLLLAPHGNGEVWELVYMGIVPDARGHGFGDQIVQQALWHTAKGGGRRLVLAVDESNEPALTMYHRGSLVSWERRQVYARLREGKPLSTRQSCR